MKKKGLPLLAGIMTAALLFGGCGEKGNTKDAPSADSAAKEDITISTGELLAATDYDADDYVKLNDYMNMAVELEDIYEVTDEDIAQYADSQILPAYPSYEVTDKTTVEDGDIVNIDYVGTRDGEAFDGGSDQGYHLTIGSDSFIDGFEDGLIGKSVGETVELPLTFPENYQSEELAGQAVVFTVTINSIEEAKTVSYEELDDAFVSDNFAANGISTKEAFTDQVRSTLEYQNEQIRQNHIQNAVLEKLTEECEVEFPEGLLEQKKADYKETVQHQAENYGMDFETFIGMTQEEFEEQTETYVSESLMQELILEAVVGKENISISQNDFQRFVSSYISYYQLSGEEEFYEQFGSEEYVQLSYAENQALNLIVESTQVTYTDEAPQTSEK